MSKPWEIILFMIVALIIGCLLGILIGVVGYVMTQCVSFVWPPFILQPVLVCKPL